jgi:hypothetical protein
MIGNIAIFAAGFYAGGAVLTFLVVGGSMLNRFGSALIWPTWPLWPG